MKSPKQDLRFRWYLAGGEAEYDEPSGRLTVHGEPVHLEKRPALLLLYLLRRAGEVVPHEQLLRDIWENRTSDNVVANAVSKIRNALRTVSEVTIDNLSRRGYRLVGEVHGVVAQADFSNKLSLARGLTLPDQSGTVLKQCLAQTSEGEVWLADGSTDGPSVEGPFVVKFAASEMRRAKLRHEVAQASRLAERLGKA